MTDREPIPPQDLLRMANFLDGMTYTIRVNPPPTLSEIDFYDFQNGKSWCNMRVRLHFEKDLDAVARHMLRFMRVYYVEIFTTEYCKTKKFPDLLFPDL